MADNLVVATGSGSTVSTDDIGNIHYQRIKNAFGGDGTATDVSFNNPLPVFTVGQGTVTLAGTNPTYQTNSGTVYTGNTGTVTLTGTNPVFQTNNGTVTLTGVNPVYVTNTGTVLTGNTGTVTLTGTNPVFQTNNGTVTLTGTNPVYVTNSATAFINNAATVTMGSAVAGGGWTLLYAPVSLSATGTVVSAVTSKKIKVFSEVLTVAGGTVELKTMSGAAGGTIRGAMQFSPLGGMAWANPHFTPLYETAAGSPLVYSLVNIVGSGTVGGMVGYFAEA